MGLRHDATQKSVKGSSKTKGMMKYTSTSPVVGDAITASG